MRLFRSKEHPDHWIGEDAHGVLMIWPVRPRGWMKRNGYAGSKRVLEEIDPALARGTGWPGTRGGRRPLRGAPSKPLTLRVTDAERAAWQRAAGERKISDWIRDTCNAAAPIAEITRPRSKPKP